MPFLLLIIDRGERRQWSETQAREAVKSMVAFRERLQARGILQGSSRLQTVSDGARVEVRNGRRLVVDGPFAESKEVVAGFILVNCRTREEAIALAAECPAAAWSMVEVRETVSCEIEGEEGALHESPQAT